MNQEKLLGNWQQVKGNIKKKWAKLTDDDLLESEGKREVIIGKLTERYGYNKEKAADKFDEYLQNLDSSGNITSFASTVSNIAEEASTRATDVVKSCRDYVKGKPLTTVGVVAAAGILVGILINRSK